jgi:hypothetical protein
VVDFSDLTKKNTEKMIRVENVLCAGFSSDLLSFDGSGAQKSKTCAGATTLPARGGGACDSLFIVFYYISLTSSLFT